MTIVFSLLPAIFYSAEKDADGCKDHPLIPRLPGYYIAACNETPAGADLDIIKETGTETVHFEGKSTAYSYMPQPDLKTKLTEAQLRSNFENIVKKMNGALFGVTYGQKWPVYTISKDGKNFWIILMITPGKYYTGSYVYRIIEKN